MTDTRAKAIGLALAWMLGITALFVVLAWNDTFYRATPPPAGSHLLILLPAAFLIYLVATRVQRNTAGAVAAAMIVLSLVTLYALAVPARYSDGYTMMGCFDVYDEEVPTRVGWVTFGLLKPTQTIYVDCNGMPID